MRLCAKLQTEQDETDAYLVIPAALHRWKRTLQGAFWSKSAWWWTSLAIKLFQTFWNLSFTIRLILFTFLKSMLLRWTNTNIRRALTIYIVWFITGSRGFARALSILHERSFRSISFILGSHWIHIPTKYSHFGTIHRTIRIQQNQFCFSFFLSQSIWLSADNLRRI